MKDVNKIRMLNIGENENVDLLRNTGSYCFAPTQFMDGKFQGGLHLPKNDWKEILPSHRNPANLGLGDLDGNTLVVSRIDPEILDWFYREYISSCHGARIELQGRILKEQFSEKVTTTLIDDFCSWFPAESLKISKSILNFSYFHLIPDGSVAQRLSSTRDSRSPHGVRGLHVDNWESPRRPVRDRSLAGYKYLVNMGLEDRFFLYVDMNIQEMYRNVTPSEFGDMREIIEGSSFASPFAEWFLMKYSSYPITRLRLKPGMGLLAPVQNLIHDGDLSEKSLPDIVGMVSFSSLQESKEAQQGGASNGTTCRA